MGLFTFLIVLSILIFIHELGHFLVAKYFGVYVEVFSIGFGKKIYSKVWKNTQWRLAIIPLGGFVKMRGQNDINPSLADNREGSYNNLKPWQRIMILLAGPFANFFLAAILYFAIALMGSNALSPTIGKVVDNSPAFKAGIKADDIIIKINDKDIETWNDIGKTITSTQGALKFYIKRDENIKVLIISPQISDSKNIFNEDIKKRMIGIAPAPKIITIYHNPYEALIFAWDKTIESSKMIFLGVQKLIQGIVPSSEIGGVISIGKVISDASESGIVAIFSIMALVSVNLGVLNLLPIPALDGGHIMFNLYEIITKKKPHEKVLINLTILGWVILLGLMGLGLYNDINRLFG